MSRNSRATKFMPTACLIMQKILLFIRAILAATHCLSDKIPPRVDAEHSEAAPTPVLLDEPPQCTCIVSRLVRRLTHPWSSQHYDISMSPQLGQPSSPPSTPQGNTASDHVFRAIITALTLFNIIITWPIHGKPQIVPWYVMPRNFDYGSSFECKRPA